MQFMLDCTTCVGVAGMCMKWISIYLFNANKFGEHFFPVVISCAVTTLFACIRHMADAGGERYANDMGKSLLVLHYMPHQKVSTLVFIFVVRMQTKWSRETTTTIECMQFRLLTSNARSFWPGHLFHRKFIVLDAHKCSHSDTVFNSHPPSCPRLLLLAFGL